MNENDGGNQEVTYGLALVRAAEYHIMITWIGSVRCGARIGLREEEEDEDWERVKGRKEHIDMGESCAEIVVSENLCSGLRLMIG